MKCPVCGTDVDLNTKKLQRKTVADYGVDSNNKQIHIKQ